MMDFIKKFAKEISVFGVVIIIFLALFIYRQMTFKDFTTITEKQLTQMVEDKKDFVVFLGDSSSSTVQAYQEIMTDFTTKNRSIPVYFVDSSEDDDFDSYVEKTFDLSVSYPSTLVIKDGEVTAKKESTMQYYSLSDFIKENYNED